MSSRRWPSFRYGGFRSSTRPGRCVGIISQADIAVAAIKNSTVTEREIALVVEQISQPSGRGMGRNNGFTDSGVAPQL